ncbi:MAG: HNH endonuclease [Comamonas sp.]|nr:HNH endonuclease [Comamonas sp.]
MRQIPGFAGYFASEDGSILSENGDKTRVLSQRNKDGYMHVTISVRVNGVRQRHRHPVHRLVCMAFHGEPPSDKPLARHLNGVSTDNRAANIAWGDHKDNAADAIRHGTLGKGMRAHRRKLNDSQVKELCARLRKGESDADLAAEYGVSRYYPRKLLTGRRWSHLREGVVKTSQPLAA